MKKPEFTFEQEAYICEIIGDWYFIWDNRLVDYEKKIHRLAFAKETLKRMLFDKDWE